MFCLWKRTIKIQYHLGAKSKSQPSLYVSAGPGYLDKRNICSKWLLLLFSSADNAILLVLETETNEKLQMGVVKSWNWNGAICHVYVWRSLARNGWRGALSRRTVGANSKNPPKINFKKLWDWMVILVLATVWQILKVKCSNRKRQYDM